MEPLLDEKVVYGTKRYPSPRIVRIYAGFCLSSSILPRSRFDVDHDCIVINGNRIAPDMLIDHVLGENLLRMLHKEQKKCRLLGRKDKFFAIFVKTHGCGIIAEWTAFQSIGIVEYQILVAADQCFYFSTKYKRSERLGDIIIRSK